MRLRKECEHGRYDTHYRDDPEDEFGGTLCPGGQLLPEGALVIEKVDGRFPPEVYRVLDDYPERFYTFSDPRVEALKALGVNFYEVPRHMIVASVIRELEALDALASQVEESE